MSSTSDAISNRGADAIVETFKLAGVKTIFTLSGNHIMPIFDALIDSGIRLIHTRHEAAAVHMADAYARLTGEVGIALVTGGPGHANAISALYTAQMAESPVILISGHAPLSQLGKGAFQEMEQAKLAKPIAKASWLSNTLESLPFDFAKAVRIAKSGRPGVVHLSIPIDLLETQYPPAFKLPSEKDFLSTIEVLPKDIIQKIVQTLTNAKKPLILTGPEMQSKSGRLQLARLEKELGIPVIGMESPRGILDPSLGSFAQVLAQSDCVLFLGKKIDFTVKFGQSPTFLDACQFLQIDPDVAEIEKAKILLNQKLELSCNAEVKPVIEALIEIGQTNNTHEDWCAIVHKAIEYRPESWLTASVPQGFVHPAKAFAQIQTILDSHSDSVLICDGGEIGQWAQACLHAPHRIINGVAGAIGAGIPFATAASLVKDGAPIVAVMGDGSFGFHCAEIDTAVRYDLPYLLVIGNDACWNAEHQIQLREYGKGRTMGCDLLPTRYDDVARGFGGHGESVNDLADLLHACQRALDSQLPACINMMIPSLAAPNLNP
jgi:acetolactate synthase I/II/III large subunit